MKKPKIALVFKDFAAWLRSSCVGLHVAGFATAQVLREHGFDVVVFPVRNNVDLVHAIDKYNQAHEEPLTHVIISAPWLSGYDAKQLIEHFASTKFVILSHSNVGFLQADPCGVELIRYYMQLAETHENLSIGGNNERFTRWLEKAFGKRSVLLPNLYPLDGCMEAEEWDGNGPLKIGAFGAIRPYKNFMTAAGAALVIARELDTTVELHMSSGADGQMTAPAIQQMCADMPNIKLITHSWVYWYDFINLVGAMDLLLQPSYTESFNMITADGIFMGVPSVVSPAIAWAPPCWMAEPDDAVQIAEIGIQLLQYKLLANEGRHFLHKHNEAGLHAWKDYMEGEPKEVQRPSSWVKRLEGWLNF